MNKKLSTFNSSFSSFQDKQLSTRSGFTLIELLIVIAVLGVLAAVVLVAINPIEQLARTRDAGRKTAVGQLKNAVQAYFTSRNGTYPAETATWITTLVNTSEFKQLPTLVNYAISTPLCDTAAVPTNMENYYCYRKAVAASGNDEVVVFVTLESGSEKGKCTLGSQQTIFMWSSLYNQAGTVCAAVAGGVLTQPNPAQATPFTFVN